MMVKECFFDEEGRVSTRWKKESMSQIRPSFFRHIKLRRPFDCCIHQQLSGDTFIHHRSSSLFKLYGNCISNRNSGCQLNQSRQILVLPKNLGTVWADEAAYLDKYFSRSRRWDARIYTLHLSYIPDKGHESNSRKLSRCCAGFACASFKAPSLLLSVLCWIGVYSPVFVSSAVQGLYRLL